MFRQALYFITDCPNHYSQDLYCCAEKAESLLSRTKNDDTLRQLLPNNHYFAEMIGIPEHEKLPQLMKLSGHHIFFSFVPFSHSLNTRVLFGIVLGGIIIKPQYYIFSKFQQLSYISLKNLNLKIINNYEVRVIFRHISISQSVSSSLSVSLSLCPSLSFSVSLSLRSFFFCSCFHCLG